MLASVRSPINVRYEDGVVIISGSVQQNLKIFVDKMLKGLLNTPSERSIDLLCIAAGTYALDRAVRRKKEKGNDAGVRTFQVCFQVSDVGYWDQPETIDLLTDITTFLTGDTWLISFCKRDSVYHATTQTRLSIDWPMPPRRLALYSGGLDSAAGFANRLLDGIDDYLLLTIGHQSAIRSNCVNQIRILAHELHAARRISHASLLLKLDGGVAERISFQERSQRSRAFLFCAAAAVVAYASNIQEIEIFENGVGAINLPPMEGMLGDGMSTRGAHPGFLNKMSALTSSAFDHPMNYRLPFLWWTKAEMIKGLKRRPRLVEWAQSSRSCVHTSIRKRRLNHCGVCPACIERRQAVIAADVIESPLYPYEQDVMSLVDPFSDDYLRCYMGNADAWINNDPSVRERLGRHRVLSDIEDLDQQHTEQLHVRHAHEVRSVFGGISYFS